MRQFGLIGKTLKHSFSKKYFEEKFSREKITDCRYDLFELDTIEDLEALIHASPALAGLNVTIPYKKEVMRFLDRLDHSAEKVGAVNVVKKEGDRLAGYNSDYYGFRSSLSSWMTSGARHALILGTGGSSRAVQVALDDLGLSYQHVSRSAKKGCLTYEDIRVRPDLLHQVDLVVNTTPLGMYPEVDKWPDLPFEAFRKGQYVFDLIYNPEETRLMAMAKAQGASAKNGLEMLVLQAEKSWEIWNS